MSVDADFDLKCIAIETPAGTPPLDLALITNTPTFTHDVPVAGKLNATSTPPVTKVFGDEITLVAGALTLDLTALDAGDLPDVNFDTLKVQLCKIVADANNSADMVFKPGAANPYFLFGDANAQITLGPGDAELFFRKDNLPDVANGSADQIDITSTMQTAKAKIILVAG